MGDIWTWRATDDEFSHLNFVSALIELCQTESTKFNGKSVEENENLSLARFAKLFDLNLFPRNNCGLSE